MCSVIKCRASSSTTWRQCSHKLWQHEVRLWTSGLCQKLDQMQSQPSQTPSRQMTALWAQNLNCGDVALSSAISQTVTAHVDEASADLKKKQKVLEDIDADMAERQVALDTFRNGLETAVRTGLDV